MSNLLHEIEEAIYNGDEEIIEDLVQQALDAGISPEEIIAGGGVAGLDRLGEDFNNLEVYLPELMIGGDCMKLLIEKVKPYLKAGESAYSGKIVIGCAKGDLHDIGKAWWPPSWRYTI
jgi:5-methyltetrahydrofolate--homocysteine methyltransferase